ncbi:hypothetical protein ID866_3352 [Astraeus odoratus]|nr:hypothetical protein ID866_3352 [Astraeus odoratus]
MPPTPHSGRVRIAQNVNTQRLSAIKIVSKGFIMNPDNKPTSITPRRHLHNVEREIVIMKLIDHPNILRLYDVWETSSDLYLILEYAEGGELFDHICNHGPLSTAEALHYFQQIIFAVDYCHRFNIAHRDLKPENLLLDQNRNIKVADFGMAAWQAKYDNGLMKTACGSPHYAAPEVITGKEYDGRSSDIWSCGVVLFVLLTGRLPFDEQTLPALLAKVKSARYDMPSRLDPMARDLVSKMLQKDAERRITMAEILAHPFFLSQHPATMNKMPNLDVMSRPIRREENIDCAIFANLKTLWYDTPDEDIVESLRNNEPNWQKGVYHLLIAYRYKHFEDGEDEDEDDCDGVCDEVQNMDQWGKGIEETHQRMIRTISQAADLGHSPLSPPPRAAAPTPERAGRIYCDVDLPHANALQIHAPSPSSPAVWPTLTAPAPGDGEAMQYLLRQVAERLDTHAIHGHTVENPDLHREKSPSIVAGSEILTPSKRSSGVLSEFTSSSSIKQDTRSFKSAGVSNVNCRSGSAQLHKENQHPSGDEPGPRAIKRTSLRSVDGEPRRRSPRVHIVEPSPRKLRRRKSFVTTIFSLAQSESSLTLSSMPRRRWLSSVFKFKPESYELLSIHNGLTSRVRCRKLLVALGIRVTLTYEREAGVLECTFDGIENPSGVLPVSKFVRFRVEVQQTTMPQALAGYRVAMRFILEKGASSSFQIIYHRFQRMWESDLPGSLGTMYTTLTETRRCTESSLDDD